MSNIARLGVILGLSSAEFVAGIDGAKRKTKELEATFTQLKIGAAAVGTALVAATLKTMQFADEIADTADAYQTSIKNVLDLSEALAQSGGKADTAGRLLGQFANNVDEAAQGSKTAQDAFKRIGISLDDLRRLDNEELLKKTLENLQNIKDPIERNALAFDVFGKAVRGVDLTKLSSEMLHGAGATESQIKAVRTLGDSFDKLHAVIFKTKLIFAEALAPAFKAAEINFGGMGKSLENIGSVLKKAAEGFVFLTGVIIESVKVGIKQLNDLWMAVGNAMNPFTDKGFWDTLNQRTAQSWKEFKDNIRGLAASDMGGETGGSAFGGRTVKAAKDSEADKQKNMLYTAQLISVEYERQLKFEQQQLVVREQMVGYTQDERKKQEAINAVLDMTSRKIDEIRKQQEDAAGRGASDEVIQSYNDQIDKVREMGDSYAEQAGRIAQASIDAQRTFSFGWQTAFKQYAEDAYNNAQLAASMFGTFTGAMNQAIANFVQTGKFQFKDFVRSVLQGLLQIQLQMLAMRLITGAINYGMGAMQDAYLNSDSFVGPRLPGKASGGSVTSDTPYLVGERGPELFIPSRNGAIVPNGQLAGAMGGNAPQIVYNGPYIANMNAMDTQSAAQFLARNKDAVYAANMSASRSVPTSVR